MATDARLTQQVLEVVRTGQPDAQLTQVVLEVVRSPLVPKPAAGTPLNLSDAAVPTYAWVLTEGSGAPVEGRTGVEATLSGAVWGAHLGTTVLKHSVTSAKTTLASDSTTLLPTGAITVMLGYRKHDSVAREAGVFGVLDSATSTTLAGVLLPASTGTMQWDYGGTSEGVTRLSVSGLSVDTTYGDVWAFTAGAAGMEIWQGETKVAAHSASPTRTQAAAAPLVLGGHASVADSDLADYQWWYIWHRQLPSAAISALASNPFTVWGSAAVAAATGRRPGLVFPRSGAVRRTMRFTDPD